MPGKPVTIFLSAAEASGDEHAARLAVSLRDRLPNVRLVGVAGEKMAAAGVEVVADLTHRASMLGGAIAQLGYWIKTVNRIKRSIAEIKPDVMVPVDSPALNWHLAGAAKKAGSPVVYYIAPQVWAWAPWRVRKLARLTDKVACILPFEEPYLRHRGVNATYVGHPLMESLSPSGPEYPDILDAWANGTLNVALLQGSRAGEIQHHCEALLACATEINRRFGKAKCTFTARNAQAADAIRKVLKGADLSGIEIAVGRTREVLAQSHFAVAVSGTVTLEVAHYGVPMVTFYRTPWFFRQLYKILGGWGVPTAHFSLVNILAGRRIVPELMPWNGRSAKLVDMVMEVLDEPGCLLEARQDLLAVMDSLRGPAHTCASDNAADLIVQTIGPRT